MAAKIEHEVINIDISEMKGIIQMAALMQLEGENLNLLFHGSPGIGKTQGITSALTSLDYHVREMKAPTMDPVDVGGFPYVKDEISKWAPPEFLMPPEDGKPLAIFIDEVNRATGMTQNSLLSLIQERSTRNVKLAASTIIIAACNREGDDIGIQPMSRALRNRFTHLFVRTSVDGFCKYAVDANIHPVVIGTIRSRPELLNPAYDDDDPKEMAKWKNAKAYPTPRTWETTSKLLYRTNASNKEMMHSIIAGRIGYGPSIEVMAIWEAIDSLPSIDNIFMNPDTAKVPNEPSHCYAVANAISKRIDIDNIERGITYLNRLDLEYNVLSIKEVLRRDETLAACKAYRDWCVKFDGVF